MRRKDTRSARPGAALGAAGGGLVLTHRGPAEQEVRFAKTCLPNAVRGPQRLHCNRGRVLRTDGRQRLPRVTRRTARRPAERTRRRPIYSDNPRDRVRRSRDSPRRGGKSEPRPDRGPRPPAEPGSWGGCQQGTPPGSGGRARVPGAGRSGRPRWPC